MRVLVTNPPLITTEGNKIEEYVRAGARWPSKKKEIRSLTELKKARQKEKSFYAPFPFFLAYSAAILRENGHVVSVIDAGALGMLEKEFVEEVRRRRPELVIIETSTPTIKMDLKYAEVIKEITNSKIVLTGPHVSVYPKEILKDYSFVDYIAIGEYEYTIAELVSALDQNKDETKIKGLAVRKRDGEVAVNERRPLIDPLDELPYPARDLFPIDSHNDISVYHDGFEKAFPSIQIVSSRGCPFKCNFCVWPQVMYNSHKYRTFSPKRVVDEMEYCLDKYNPKTFYFDDDSFVINKKHVLGICKEIRERGINIKWSCMGDAMAVDREMLREMSRAGCVAMKFGVESASPEVLKKIGKPLDLSRVLDVVEWCKEYGVRTHATFCFGLLGDTPETIKKTIEFASNLDVDGVQFSTAIPYPGTRFYKTAEKEGWLLTNDWSKYDESAIVKYPELSVEELDNLRGMARKEWNNKKIRNIRWILRRLRQNYREAGVKDVMRSIKNGLIMLNLKFKQ